MNTKYKYIHFEEQPPIPGRKTKTYECLANRDDVCLGSVAWYGPWRQYCFYPVIDYSTIFNAGCLADIQDFLEQLRVRARKPKKEGKE